MKDVVIEFEIHGCITIKAEDKEEANLKCQKMEVNEILKKADSYIFSEKPVGIYNGDKIDYFEK